MKVRSFGSWSLSFVAPVLAACAGAPDEPAKAPTTTVAPVVYGEDGRQDWYAIDNAALKAQAHDSVAAMIPWDYLSQDEAGVPTIYGEPTLGETYGLCADQRFRDQPTAAVCSGTLIAEDLVLTAGHCMTDLSDCAGSAWVFDYLYDAEGVRAPMTADSVYRCVDIIVRPGVDLEDDLDMAILQLDRPVTGRVPAKVAPEPTLSLGTPLVLAGYPNGIPLKVDTGGVVRSPRSAQSDYFIASVDAFSGNSGSGVLDADFGVIGVLVSGADDYANAGTCVVVSTLDPDEAEESVMYAYHAAAAVCERGYPSIELCPESLPATCGDGFCTGHEAREGCVPDCDGLFAVPAAWTCDAGWYHAGDDCDCNCGTFDPDCNDRDLDVVNCAPGSACNHDGTCREPIPEGWQCAPSSYGDGDRCNCDCGVPDPDCADASLDQTGCAPGGECQADGVCSISLPDGWDCRRRFYGSGDGCDCNCGARDPDCDDPEQAIYGCVAGSACLADGSCELPVPTGWVCDVSVYGAGDECDCNCGIYDPDCDKSTVVRNCNGTDVCAADGTCTERVVEPEPEPEVVEAGPEAAEEIAEEVVAEVVEVEADVAVEDDVSGEDATIADADASSEGDAAADTGNGGKVKGGGCAGGDSSGAAGGAALALVAVVGVVRRRRA